MTSLDQRIRTDLNCYDQDAAGQIDHLTDAIRGVLDHCDQLDAHQDPTTSAITRDIRNVIAAELGIVPGDTSVPEALRTGHAGGPAHSGGPT